MMLMIVVYIYNYVIYLMALHFIDAPVMADQCSLIFRRFHRFWGFFGLLGSPGISWAMAAGPILRKYSELLLSLGKCPPSKAKSCANPPLAAACVVNV
jgi:hypothetical protein